VRKDLGISSNIIQMVVNGMYLSQNCPMFLCDNCDYICNNKRDFKKHLSTRKHQNGSKMVVNGSKMSQMSPLLITEQISKKYVCKCGKAYIWESGYYRHKKSCLVDVEAEQSVVNHNEVHVNKALDKDIDKELLIKMLLKNQDVMEKMIELMPQIGNYSHNTNSNNTTNNQFNIQMFLNEHCKNAMNLTDFIDSLPITADTYDSTIENGLTKTLTNMITNGLSQLDILERPIHCTDATRKTLYVKEANNWEKDTELLRILLGIKTLARKQWMMINKWQDANEGWETEDYIQTKLTTLISHSMTNIESDEKETSKIVRAISKNVFLDNETKQQYLK